jgi:hypothetical protein
MSRPGPVPVLGAPCDDARGGYHRTGMVRYGPFGKKETGAAGVTAAPVGTDRELVHDDACGRGAGGQGRRGGGQLGQVAALGGERADGADPALIDEQVTAVGAQPGIDRPDPAGLADRGAASRVSVSSGAIW